MELDVHLSRQAEQPWGFRLIGGTDFKMPLTVVKVLPDSPAEKAGLQNGDTVSRIADKIADDLSHEEAKKVVAAAGMKLQLGVKRGLYDPVLDDYEPMYEDLDQIDRADIDQPSQPTEVLDTFKIQQFLDPNQDIFPPNDLQNNLKPSESRSLTASPFILPAKPYRPFSTEPLPEIPPLEDPIILNPNYSDEFGKIIDGFEDLDLLVGKFESKFKLPISEQYDPDWETKGKMGEKKTGVQVKVTDTKIDNVNKTSMEKTEVRTVKSETQEMKEDIAFMKKMKQEIDLDKIEMTATSIVDESIEKAKAVAEEIKKEIDVEISESSILSTTEVESKSVVKSSQSCELKSDFKETVQKVDEKYESVQKNIVTDHEDLGIVKREARATKEIREVSEIVQDSTKEVVKVAQKVEKFETIDMKDHASEDRKKSMQQEVEETIEAGSVRRKSMMFDKEETNVDAKVKSVEDVKKVQAKMVDKSDTRKVSSVEHKTSETKVSGSKTSSCQAEQRSYTIGLKTIPNIRGTLHSSCHYNLLLQTFFLHLTDVMVALSRFILSEPIFNKTEEKQDTVTTKETSSSTYESKSDVITKDQKDVGKVSETKVSQKEVKVSESTMVQKEQPKEVVVQDKMEVKDVKEVKNEKKALKQLVEKVQVAKKTEKAKVHEQVTIKDDVVEHKKAITGSEMAQLSEKKSEELTVKMDAVISEFENKTGIDEVSERQRRSRSRSQVVEEVMKESDSLERLSKHETHKTQEISELKISSSEFSSKVESTAVKREISTAVTTAAERKIESRQSSRPRSTTPNEGKQMYVAIVESHVYTNKDAILLDQSEISETASVQSVEETNVALESVTAMATEKVSMERSEMKEHNSSFVEDKREEVSLVSKQVEETVQKSHEVVTEQIKEVEESKEVKAKHEEVMQIEEKVQESKDFVAEKKVEVAVQQVNEPIIELYESKHIDISEESQRVSIKEESLEIAKKETVEIQEISSESMAIEEYETHGHVELAKEETATVKEEQTVELDVNADIKIEKVEPKSTEPIIESAALKIVKEEIVEVQPSPEILESEETKVLKIEKIVDLSQATVVESDSKFLDISESSSLDSIDIKSKTAVQESSFTAKLSSQQSEASFTATSMSQSVQELSFVAKSNETSAKKLTLKTDIIQKVSEPLSPVSGDENNNIDTPTPSTVPPTPLTDEYVFKLKIPLPKTSGAVVPLDLTPEEEDIHIAKKKLVPHIETTLESPIIYDPPLPSPPGSKVGSPVYTKPGLRGGNMRAVRMEEILEIERKSTLLASAIDETIKSIEEYKEQVGMETKIEESETYSSKTENYSREEKCVATVSKSEVKSKMEDEWSEVDIQVEDNNKTLTELSKVVIEESQIELMNGFGEDITNKIAIENMPTTESNSIKDKPLVIENMPTTESTATKDKPCQPEEVVKETYEQIKDKVIAEMNEKLNGDRNSTDIRKGLNVLTNGEIKMRNGMVDVGSVPVREEREEIKFVEEAEEEKEDPMKGYRPVVFNPEQRNPRVTGVYIDMPPNEAGRPYTTPTGELLGTHQGIVDGLEEATVDEEVAKELGKPGMTEDKIAELISGESEMLREAHVMGLSRVLKSHMSRPDDDSSVDFKKIKPIVESLKDSEVLKALNDELMKTKEEKKKEERKWTTFLQKPKRDVPRAKFGYYGYVGQEEQVIEAPYKVKIVKQPKPKVAPDYKPETFETGPLPWEERALLEPPPPPVEAEEPILVPEEVPEFLEAVDPLPESEVPDLEETGIQLPPPKSEEIKPTTPELDKPPEEPEPEVKPEPEKVVEPAETKEDMENRLADQLMTSVQNMVDPNASLEQQLAQMRAQLAALAQLPGVIQQTLELVTRQLSQFTQQESMTIQTRYQTQESQDHQCVISEVTENHEPTITEETVEDVQREEQNEQTEQNEQSEQNAEEMVETQPSLTQEEMEKLRKEEEEMLEEQRRIEKQKKEMMEQMRLDQESRQVKQRPTPRVGKPKPVFGNGGEPRPIVLTGGRKWRGPKDAYNEQFIAETLSAQAEIIQGKAMGMSFESDILPYDSRINFLKYEKPPVSLDHLQNSDVYKMVHGMEGPARRVDLLTPVVCEADYREKCRSISPCVGRMAQEQHQDFPQQLQP